MAPNNITMVESLRQEWVRSSLLNISMLGDLPSDSEGSSSNQFALHRISLHEAVPYVLISKEGSRPRKRFQARTSHRRAWEHYRRLYREEKLIETVQRKRTSGLYSISSSDDVQRSMGVLHVQALLLQRLAEEDNRAKGYIKIETSQNQDASSQLAEFPNSADLSREVGSAIRILWA